MNNPREKGVALETALRLTGHKSVATVLRYYRETPDADLKAAVAALDDARGGASAGTSEPRNGSGHGTEMEATCS